MYKVGSRKSLLAQSQFKLLKNLHRKLSFDYIPITSRGDLKKDKLPGLYTSTLDEALKNKSIDLALHCLKDVPLKRPSYVQEILRIERRVAHDIILFRKDCFKKEKILIGTHSERRKEQLKNLHLVLPEKYKKKKFQDQFIEGNLLRRLELLQNKDYDALILSLEGLERFTEDNFSLSKKLLKSLTFIILPLHYFPTSAGQGDLTLEIYKSHPEEKKLKHHFGIKKNYLTDLERKDLKKLEGGCSSPIGITYVKIRDYLVKFFFHKKIYEPIFLRTKNITKKKVKKVFIGSKDQSSLWISDNQYLFKKIPSSLKKKKLLYFTSKHSFIPAKECIVAGLSTWKEACKKNIWVYASHEGLGESFLEIFKNFKSLNILHPFWKKDWYVCTHEEGKSILGKIYPTYETYFKKTFLDPNISHFYWMSAQQAKNYFKHYPWIKNKNHFCGLGKTYDELKKIIKINYLSGVEEFKKLYVRGS